MKTPVSTPPRGIDDSRITLTTVFELLASRRRRYALYCLSRSERELTIDELANRIGVLEDEPTRGHAETVRIDLQHRHLPKLLDTDVVRSDGGRVGLARTAERLEPYLELAAREFHADPGPHPR